MDSHETPAGFLEVRQFIVNFKGPPLGMDSHETLAGFLEVRQFIVFSR